MTMNEDQSRLINPVMDVLKAQSEALSNLANNLDTKHLTSAVDIIESCKGHVIISGMGKSGLVGQKISATLASTGTPSFYMHPSEAFHGDLGRITPDDTVILISNSGETTEVLQLIPSLKRFGNKIIAITNVATSSLGKHSDAILDLQMKRESCPNNLAPTTSTTLTIALGDALAVCLMRRKAFKPSDFALFHPGGSLGKRLLSRVSDVMNTSNLPIVSENSTVLDAVFKMTSSDSSGLAIVTNEVGKVSGVISDGDLRREMPGNIALSGVGVCDVMNRQPITIYEDDMLETANNMMKMNRVGSLVVLNHEQYPVGLLKIHSI
ncbi:KpsF/GutQ family sugar-phosphate isomerase [Vibrio barjaei]|uniref:KpsF/GutQ family sugar-phosphate isomerase n=1 Tax=Vibrio barjaei TaxID=1676683 RepID=UPI002283DDD3|nr:KpsF/GutQ family sugar-phosphate isomerase [Vibrio barjaei]MCY9872371.1 KpsF/GutQ family sugar-phosphate isomerase [Vibrio barjaei]